MHVFMYVYVCVCMCMYVYIYMCVCVYVYIYMYMCVYVSVYVCGFQSFPFILQHRKFPFSIHLLGRFKCISHIQAEKLLMDSRCRHGFFLVRESEVRVNNLFLPFLLAYIILHSFSLFVNAFQAFVMYVDSPVLPCHHFPILFRALRVNIRSLCVMVIRSVTTVCKNVMEAL